MLIGVYGASGFGREVLPIVRQSMKSSDRVVFIDDSNQDEKLNETDVVDWEGFISLENSEKSVCIAIADANIRSKIVEKCDSSNISLINIFASNSVVLDEVELADGAIICPFVMLTSNIKIGRSFHANIYSYVAHDCVIGDFVTLAPSVKCNGNVVIEDYAYIGTGAIIKQGSPGKPTVIGKGAVVGMGAVVTKDVAPGAIVVGNPAKPLERK